jgi:hypothetical protein
MKKSEAIELLGGSPATVAEAIGVTPQAVSNWPAQLSPRIADRVQAALWRRHQACQQAASGAEAEPESSNAA